MADQCAEHSEPRRGGNMRHSLKSAALPLTSRSPSFRLFSALFGRSGLPLVSQAPCHEHRRGVSRVSSRTSGRTEEPTALRARGPGALARPAPANGTAAARPGCREPAERRRAPGQLWQAFLAGICHRREEQAGPGVRACARRQTREPGPGGERGTRPALLPLQHRFAMPAGQGPASERGQLTPGQIRDHLTL